MPQLTGRVIVKRIALGTKQLTPDPWLEEIPGKYHVGDLLSGYVTKTTSFGAFVKLEDDLEGLLHISELSDSKIESPDEVLCPGMKAEVRVIRVDIDERKIGLSFVHADFEGNEKLREKQAAAQAEEQAAEAQAEAEQASSDGDAAEGGDEPAEG